MEHARHGEASGRPASSMRSQLQPVALAATPQLRAPQPSHPFPEQPEAVEVSRYRVIVEVALHDRPEPLARLRAPDRAGAAGVAA